MPFPVPTASFYDESLLGYVARAADQNGHPDLRHVLLLAGIEICRAELLPRAKPKNLVDLASFLGCRADDIESRFYNKAEVTGTTSEFMDFFGSPVRAFCREPRLRRVSPTSLRNSPHHKSAWLLRPLAFCRESSELLISRCPNPACGKPLGWKRGFGIQYCEHCLDDDSEPTTNLCDYEQPKLSDAHADPLLFVAGLADPHPNVRAETRRRLPASLRSYASWEVFDLALLLGFIHCRRFSERKGMRLPNAFLLDDWTDSLAIAGNVVLRWPTGIEILIDSMRTTAETRDGYFGQRKEIGPLAYCHYSEGMIPKVSDEIKKAVMRHYREEGRKFSRNTYKIAEPNEFIRYNNARFKYGLSTNNLRLLLESKTVTVIRKSVALRAPVYIKEAELAAAVKVRNDLFLLSRLRLVTGFPPHILHELTQSGHIQAETGPGASLRGAGPYIRSAELTDFSKRIRAKARPARDDDLPLKQAMRECGISPSLFTAALQGCLSGDLAFSLQPQNSSIMHSMSVRAEDLGCWIIKHPQPYSASKPPKRMTFADVMARLDISHSMVSTLLDLEVLTSVPHGKFRQISGESVEKFERKYITSGAVVRALDLNYKHVKKQLTERGINPAYERDNISLWPRDAVNRLIEAKFGSKRLKKA